MSLIDKDRKVFPLSPLGEHISSECNSNQIPRRRTTLSPRFSEKRKILEVRSSIQTLWQQEVHRPLDDGSECGQLNLPRRVERRTRSVRVQRPAKANWKAFASVIYQNCLETATSNGRLPGGPGINGAASCFVQQMSRLCFSTAVPILNIGRKSMIPYIGPEMINALLRREITSSCPPASSPHSP